MPFRIIGYDGAAYRSQLQQERTKILPVITIVLYFGTDRHWRSGKNIKSLMEIPTGLDEFVSDYQIKVFEVAWLSEEQIRRFRSDTTGSEKFTDSHFRLFFLIKKNSPLQNNNLFLRQYR